MCALHDCAARVTAGAPRPGRQGRRGAHEYSEHILDKHFCAPQDNCPRMRLKRKRPNRPEDRCAGAATSDTIQDLVDWGLDNTDSFAARLDPYLSSFVTFPIGPVNLSDIGRTVSPPVVLENNLGESSEILEPPQNSPNSCAKVAE